MILSNQIESFTDDEISFLLYFINKISPICNSRIEFKKDELKWFRSDVLAKRLVDNFESVNPDAHEIFKSILSKFGISIEIKKELPKVKPIVEVSAPISSSVEPLLIPEVIPATENKI